MKLKCRDEYARGVEDRKRSPLYNGLYKLLEVRRHPESVIVRLTELSEARCRGESLNNYFGGDHAGHWLKGVPASLAYRIGKDLVPSIEALTGDGLPRAEIDHYLLGWRHLEVSLLNELEVAEYRLKRWGVKHEYALWAQGDSELLLPCKTFLNITRAALEVFDQAVPSGLTDAQKREIFG